MQDSSRSFLLICPFNEPKEGSQVKKILLFLGIVSTAVILAVFGIKYYNSYQAEKYDVLAIPYLEALIPKISTWQEDVIRENLAFRARKQLDPEKLSAIIATFSKLGELKSYSTPKFEQVARSMTEKDEMYRDEDELKTILTYKSDAVYEHGDAVITFILAVKEEQLDLYYFNIQSNALLQRSGS